MKQYDPACWFEMVGRHFSNNLNKENRMITCPVEVVIPEECRTLDQNEEWIEIVIDGKAEKIRLHDYGRFYEIPGFYDQFYRNLQCRSPQVVCETLKRQMAKCGQDGNALRVLDFGAGNGQVGERLRQELGCETLVGLDIIPEAREAALRDRPAVYDNYYVMDLADPSAHARETLGGSHFNALVTVAALGFGDIGTRAFVNAYNLVADRAWVAFNIKECFLSDSDNSGFSDIIDQLIAQGFELLESRRYCHRLSLAGEQLHYRVIVGRKNGNIRGEQ